jgi:hypothetical protein
LGLGNEGGLAVASHLSPVEYEQLISAIREVVHRVVPLNATVLVVSRGDDELTRLGPRTALHFPQQEDGRYAGYHPADSEAAIAMVEKLRERGAQYLLFPQTGFWWLEYYEGFRKYLEDRYQVVEAGEQCWIVQLAEGTSLDADTSFMAEATRPHDTTHPLDELLDALLPQDARVALLDVGSGTGDSVGGYDTWLMPKEPPADVHAVMDSLGSLEHSGAEFLVIPANSFDWLSEHPEVSDRLRSRHRFVTRQEHLCEIFELHPPVVEPSPTEREESNVEAHQGRGRNRPSFGEKLRGFLFPARRNDPHT